MKRAHVFFVNVSLLIISLTTVLFLGEIISRIYYKVTRGIPFFQSLDLSHYDETAWKVKMILGDIHTKKYKIFVVGDSFTHGVGVEEQNMYYNVIGKSFNAEIFVCSGGGYGTLQEYIAIDKYLDQIKPDLIILQVHPNDFINNLWELESKSFVNNSYKIRPYLINGKIEYRFPRSPEKLVLFLLNNSRLFYYLLPRIEIFCTRLAKIGILHSVDEDIKKLRLNFSNFNKAVLITNEIVAKIKSRIDKIPLVAFTVKDRHLKEFRFIFRTNHLEFIESIPGIIKQKGGAGFNLKLADREHWNKEGQRICGEALQQQLTKRGLCYIDNQDRQKR